MDNAVPPDFAPKRALFGSVTGRTVSDYLLSPPMLGNDFTSSAHKLTPTACSLLREKSLLLSVFTFGSNVQVMNWPESLREIGYNAFNVGVRIKYEINSEGTSVLSSIQDKWPGGVPTTLEKLGEGAFSGNVNLGAWAIPYWRDDRIYDLGYSDDALGACGPFGGTLIYPTNLTSVTGSCFMNNVMLEEIVLHNSVTNIGANAFMGCSKLSLVIPASVREVGRGAGASCSVISYGVGYLGLGPKSVVFEGKPPKGIVQSGFLGCSQVLVSEEYAADWAPYMSGNMKIAKKINGQWVALGSKAVSNAMRPSDPTIMDIKYTVTSTKDKVDVRLLAFQDGNRSFAKVLRPETFVEGTEANVGNGVAANVEHTVSWQVSKDWDVDLAKVSIEVYVKEDNLLPLSTFSGQTAGIHTRTDERNAQEQQRTPDTVERTP